MIKIKKLYNFPEITQVNNPDGTRHYVCPETGLNLPSVTTVLSATSDEKWIKDWEKRVGLEEANKIRKEATDLGTLVHLHLEKYVLGEDRPVVKTLMEKMAFMMAEKVIENGLDEEFEECWATEARLFVAGLYAGTTDGIGLYRGRPSIIDYKTARIMRDSSKLENYFCQLGAYATAMEITWGHKMEGATIFMVDRKMQYQEFTLAGTDLERYKKKFALRLEQYYDQKLKT